MMKKINTPLKFGLICFFFKKCEQLSQLKICTVQVLAVLSKLPNPACTTGVTTTAAALAKQGWQIMITVTIYANKDRLCHDGFMTWTSNYYGLKQFHNPCD